MGIRPGDHRPTSREVVSSIAAAQELIAYWESWEQ